MNVKPSTTMNPSEDAESLAQFWEGLLNQRGASASIPFEKYNFYHDCVLRHCGKNLIAVRDPQRTWTYDEVHEYVSRQIPLWQNYGLLPGKKVALIFPQGIDFVIALMTALRMGLCAYCLPLNDPYYSLARLERKVEKEVVEVIITPLNNEQWKDKRILWDREKNEEKDLLFEPHCYQAVEEVCPGLNVNEAFLCPLRDGLLTLPLKQGTVWAKPLSYLVQDEPFTTLAILLAGATLFDVSDQALEENPLLLKDTPIDILSVSSRLLKLWKEVPGAPQSKLKLWTTSPLLGSRVEWEDFVKQNQLSKAPHAQFYIQPMRGGITLVSQIKPYQPFTPLKPSIGIPWKCLDLSGSDEEAWAGIGFFSLDPRLILGEIQNGFVISKTTQPVREGMMHTFEEVESCVRECEGVDECMIVEDRLLDHRLASRITLLVFSSSENKEALWNLIIEKLGKGFLPDRLLSFPLYPRKKEGKIDRQWAQAQYHMGLLFKKGKSPLHLQLNQFRRHLSRELAAL